MDLEQRVRTLEKEVVRLKSQFNERPENEIQYLLDRFGGLEHNINLTLGQMRLMVSNLEARNELSGLILKALKLREKS